MDATIEARALVLDTNVVLDTLLFQDPTTSALRAQLQLALRQRQSWRWIATQAMRDELEHVLSYRHLQARLQFYARDATQILEQFDAMARLVAPAPGTTVLCRDPHDQKFIDLAVAHRAVLLSKDRQVLKLRRQLMRWDVVTSAVWIRAS